MNPSLLDRITIEPGKCGGRPCIRASRMRVSDLLEFLAHGATIEEIRTLRAENAAANARAAESPASRPGFTRPSDPPFLPEPASARTRRDPSSEG